MRFFLHTLDKIRIINDNQAWTGTPAAFLVLEPGYPGLPVGAILRYQTDDYKYYEDNDGRHADSFDALPYCDGAYLTTAGPPMVTYDAINNRAAFTGDLLLANNQAIDWRDGFGNVRPILRVSSASHLLIYGPNSGEVYIQSFTNFRIRTGGVNNRVYITSTGKVGINTTTPGTLLDVAGTMRADVLEFVRGNPIYHRQSTETDTDGDWREYADANGFYVQKRESGAWVTKHTIT